MKTSTDAVLELLAEHPDSYTVQSCCLGYGGDSFPGPMQDALETHLAILRSRLVDVVASMAALKITTQMLIDAGLNGFAFELVSESLAGKKDIKTFKPLRFEYRGVIYTLEPAVKPDAEVQP